MIFKKRNKFKYEKISPKKDGFNMPQEMHQAPAKIYRVAFVIDNEIKEIIGTEEKFYNLLLQQPSIIDVTDIEPYPRINWKIVDGKPVDPKKDNNEI